MKKTMILFAVLALFTVPAWAGGVDQIIYGSEEAGADGGLGEMDTSNEDDLFHQHVPVSGNNGPDIPGGIDDIVPGNDGGDTLPDDNAPVPEPATGILLGIGVLGLARMLRRKKKEDA